MTTRETRDCFLHGDYSGREACPKCESSREWMRGNEQGWRDLTASGGLPEATMEIPRRAYMNKWTEIEKAIMAAKEAVESGPADVRMTDATSLLSAAFDSVADYVDGI